VNKPGPYKKRAASTGKNAIPPRKSASAGSGRKAPAEGGSRFESGSRGIGPERAKKGDSRNNGGFTHKTKDQRTPRQKSSGTRITTVKNPENELVRLNKYIATSGICSRREADQLITAGLISVNGKTVTLLGTKVKPSDDVRYNKQRLQNERKVYLLLNKPKDYVTTTDDPKERKTVMLLIRNACSERIYPVGRLDRNTTGVLLFTNDGAMAKKLTHPGYNKKKIYHVFLDKSVSAGDLKKLADGITLEDGFIQPDAISYVTTENKREIGLEIHSGRNRIVRRMFESLGYKVTKLDRVYFAGLTKKNLPRGKWRFLTESEVNRLKMNAYE
jgi:23S rRNA pseudouridine2605 synthase